MSEKKETAALVLTNARELVEHQRKLRALELEAQEALTEKVKLELKIQRVILELTEEHRRTIELPLLKIRS